jgi:hypothetical protein
MCQNPTVLTTTESFNLEEDAQNFFSLTSNTMTFFFRTFHQIFQRNSCEQNESNSSKQHEKGAIYTIILFFN